MKSNAQALFARIVLPRMQEGYRLARWLTGNAADAEDVLQEASIRAFRSIENYSEGNARGWFLTIVRNSAYSWMRKNRQQSADLIDDIDLTSVDQDRSMTAMPPTPEEVLIAKTDELRLRAAVEALPLHLREALILREEHGMSYREIAEVTAVPIGTIMSRLATARRLLIKWGMEDRPGD